MKQRSDAECERLLEEVATLAGCEYDALHLKLQGQVATLAFPIGELQNPAISGYLYAWNLLDKIKLAASDFADKDLQPKYLGVVYQGIERFVLVDECLITALLAWSELPSTRRLIFW